MPVAAFIRCPPSLSPNNEWLPFFPSSVPSAHLLPASYLHLPTLLASSHCLSEFPFNTPSIPSHYRLKAASVPLLSYCPASADSHASDPRVSIKHMGCAVTPSPTADGLEEVTFLYRLADGACPKSYGTNVARLAGLPDAVVRRAAAKAQESEEERQAAAAAGAQGCSRQEEPRQAEKEQEKELARRVQAACTAAAAGGGDAAAAAAVLELQREVQRFLRLQ